MLGVPYLGPHFSPFIIQRSSSRDTAAASTRERTQAQTPRTRAYGPRSMRSRSYLNYTSSPTVIYVLQAPKQNNNYSYTCGQRDTNKYKRSCPRNVRMQRRQQSLLLAECTGLAISELSKSVPQVLLYHFKVPGRTLKLLFKQPK